MGITQLTIALPDFRYRVSSGGIVEKEICAVYPGRTSGRPHPDPAEVAGPKGRMDSVPAPDRHQPGRLLAWSVLQVPQLQPSDALEHYITTPT